MPEQGMVEKASKRTTLVLGEVEAPIGLFKVTRDPGRSRTWAKPPVEDADEDKELGDALAGSKAKSGGSGSGSGSGSSGRSRGGGTGSPKGSTSTGADDEAEKPEKPRKGVIKPDGEFVDLTEQIEEITERTTLDRLEVVSFIRREQVPRERILGAYYVGSGTRKAGKGFSPAKVLALLHRALKLRGRAAVVRWGMRSKSAVGVMVAHGSGALVVLELAYAENVLAPSPECLAHQHIELDDHRIEQMGELIDAMADGRGSLDDVRDHRAVLEAELVARAEHGDHDTFSAERYDTDEQIGGLVEVLERELATA